MKTLLLIVVVTILHCAHLLMGVAVEGMEQVAVATIMQFPHI